jgi:NADPH:quinone reductase-like Zn-dependent oxidoreductase
MTKGLVLAEDLKSLQFKDFKVENEDGCKTIQLLASSLNRRDVWITKGLYPNIQPNVILGSDGVGLCDGKKVLINPGLNWGNNENVQSYDFSVLGMPTHGTFATDVSVHSKYIYDLPTHLSIHEGAALPLAGVTAYRSIFSRCKLLLNETILITGGGGGVAMMAIQFAMASGAKVIVTSGSDEKLDKIRKLGLAATYNYKDEKWAKKLRSEHGGVDVIIDSAGGNTMDNLVSITNPGARIGFYGSGLGSWKIKTPGILFWRQVALLGSTMGSDLDFQNMIDFVSLHQIRPIVDEIIPLSDYNTGFDKMDAGNQFGKIVFDNTHI